MRHPKDPIQSPPESSVEDLLRQVLSSVDEVRRNADDLESSELADLFRDIDALGTEDPPRRTAPVTIDLVDEESPEPPLQGAPRAGLDETVPSTEDAFDAVDAAATHVLDAVNSDPPLAVDEQGPPPFDAAVEAASAEPGAEVLNPDAEAEADVAFDEAADVDVEAVDPSAVGEIEEPSSPPEIVADESDVESETGEAQGKDDAAPLAVESIDDAAPIDPELEAEELVPEPSRASVRDAEAVPVLEVQDALAVGDEDESSAEMDLDLEAQDRPHDGPRLDAVSEDDDEHAMPVVEDAPGSQLDDGCADDAPPVIVSDSPVDSPAPRASTEAGDDPACDVVAEARDEPAPIAEVQDVEAIDELALAVDAEPEDASDGGAALTLPAAEEVTVAADELTAVEATPELADLGAEAHPDIVEIDGALSPPDEPDADVLNEAEATVIAEATVTSGDDEVAALFVAPSASTAPAAAAPNQIELSGDLSSFMSAPEDIVDDEAELEGMPVDVEPAIDDAIGAADELELPAEVVETAPSGFTEDADAAEPAVDEESPRASTAPEVEKVVAEPIREEEDVPDAPSAVADPYEETITEDAVPEPTSAPEVAAPEVAPPDVAAPEDPVPDAETVSEAPRAELTPPEPSRAAPETRRPERIQNVELESVDTALAEGVDDLLTANFDTVNEVLGDAFDASPPGAAEDAELVQDMVEQVEVDDEAPTPVAEADATSGAPEAAPTGEGGGSPPVAVDAPEFQSTGEEEVIRNSAEPVSMPLPDRPASKSRRKQSADETGDGVSKMLPERKRRKKTVEEPEVIAADEPEVLAAEPEAEPKAEPAVEVEEKPVAEPVIVETVAAPQGSTPLELIIPLGVLAILQALLATLSYPLRFVPPSWRPLVDWLALSLVFWVPVVWVIALFVVGR